MDSVEVKLSLVLDPSFTPKEGEFLFEDLGLMGLYDALISGAVTPLVMGCRALSVESLLGVSIFFQRDLLLSPKCLPLLLQGAYFSEKGPTVSVHMDEDLHRFFVSVVPYLHGGDRTQQGGQLTAATQWVREYIREGSLPNLGAKSAPVPHVMDVGTNGFVLAKGVREAIPTLYRMGHLRGLVVEVTGVRKEVTVFRKTDMVNFDLVQAKVLLDEMESMSGSGLEWRKVDSEVLSPEGGTDLLLEDIVKVLLHV